MRVRKRGRSVELPPPVVELLFERAFSELLPLPEAVIGVLDFQLRKVRSNAVARECLVTGGQLPHQDGNGPSVRNDVVHEEAEQMLVVAESYKVRAEQGRPVQLEGLQRFAPEDFFGLGLTAFRSQIGRFQRGVHRVEDRLHRAVAFLGENGPQVLVAPDDFLEGPRERFPVQFSPNAENTRNVVLGGAGLHPVKEPQPFLGEGKRHARLARSLREGRLAGPGPLLQLLEKRAFFLDAKLPPEPPCVVIFRCVHAKMLPKSLSKSLFR